MCRTKLNKLLFFSDFRAYERLGASISGQVYQKQVFGPTPKSFMPTVRKLEKEKTCAWKESRWHSKPMKRLVAFREPDLGIFRQEEIDLVRGVVQELWDYDGSQISEKSHRFAGWQAADLREEIPYGMVFVDDARPLSPRRRRGPRPSSRNTLDVRLWRVELAPDVERVFQKIRNEEPGGIDATDNLLRFLARAPQTGRPGCLERSPVPFTPRWLPILWSMSSAMGSSPALVSSGFRLVPSSLRLP